MTTVLGKMIYTGDAVIDHAYINIQGEVIASIGKQKAAEAVGEYPVITPALIDPHCHIGLIRGGEPGAESEANDQMKAILAHADVLDSIQMDDVGFPASVEAGVLYSCVLPGSGNIISGKSAVIRNYATDTNSAFISRAGIKGAIGYNPMSTREWKGERPYTRMGSMAMLRTMLHEVRNKMTKQAAKEDADVTYSADEEIFKAVLSGEERLRIHVHKSDDVAALLRMVDEYHLKVTVEHTCDIHDDRTYRELAARGIPVIYGPMDSLAYKVELKHENWRNIRYLIDSGVEYGLMTDHPVILQKMLLFELRWFLRMGLSKQEALEIITRKNAELIGVDNILGTITPGKWASFVCWNGDPFSLESYPVAVYAEGKLIYSE